MHPTFLCTEFALWKCDSVLVSSRLTTDSEMQVASQFCFFFLPQMEVVYVCVPHASHRGARFASANVITGSHFAKDPNFQSHKWGIILPFTKKVSYVVFYTQRIFVYVW